MRTFIFAIVLLVPASARAEMLLAEIQHQGHYLASGTTLSLNLITFANGGQEDWRVRRGIEDVGTTFEAEQSTADRVGWNFTQPDSRITIGTYNEAGGSIDLIWSGSIPEIDGLGNRPATVTMHVPRLGFGLAGYTVSKLTQTVDRYDAVPNAQYLVVDVAQTYRLYGDVTVPEPATFAMFACCVIPVAFLRRRNNFPATQLMKFRKLRIAWSVVWGVAAVLLIVLWVRSYWRHGLRHR